MKNHENTKVRRKVFVSTCICIRNIVRMVISNFFNFNCIVMKHVTLRRGDKPVLTREPKPREVKIERPSNTRKLPIPEKFRRSLRLLKNENSKRRNDGSKIHAQKYFGFVWNSQAIYFSKRRKLKGWEKENRKYKKIS